MEKILEFAAASFFKSVSKMRDILKERHEITSTFFQIFNVDSTQFFHVCTCYTFIEMQ